MSWLLLFLLAWFVAAFAAAAFGILLLRAASREAPVPDAIPREAKAPFARRRAAR